MISFEEFLASVKRDLAAGTMRVSQPVTDYDWAVYFAVSRLRERGKTEMTLTEIYHEMQTFCKPDEL